MSKRLSDEELDRVADAISYAVSCAPEDINLPDETIKAVISRAKEANRLRAENEVLEKNLVDAMNEVHKADRLREGLEALIDKWGNLAVDHEEAAARIGELLEGGE